MWVVTLYNDWDDVENSIDDVKIIELFSVDIEAVFEKFKILVVVGSDFNKSINFCAFKYWNLFSIKRRSNIFIFKNIF